MAANRLSLDADVASFEDRVQPLIAAMTASIPFHLAGDVSEYLAGAKTGGRPVAPGKVAGGLLLLHPLYAAARCPLVTLAERQYFGRCLKWIGDNMGIGQASLLADSITLEFCDANGVIEPELPFQKMGEGHILIWAGMLLQPS